MTQAQWTSFIRWLLGVVGGILVGKGVLTSGTLSDLIDKIVAAVPVVITVIATISPITSLIWSLFAHSKTGTVAAAVALPDVKKIVATAAVADAIPSPKVVAK